MATPRIDFFTAGTVTFPVQLGDASPYVVGRVAFQVKGAGMFSFTPKARIHGGGSMGLVAADYTAVPYTNRATSTIVAAGTAITAAGFYEMDASAAEVALDGSYTSGACLLLWQAVQG